MKIGKFDAEKRIEKQAARDHTVDSSSAVKRDGQWQKQFVIIYFLSDLVRLRTCNQTFLDFESIQRDFFQIVIESNSNNTEYYLLTKQSRFQVRLILFAKHTPRIIKIKVESSDMKICNIDSIS